MVGAIPVLSRPFIAAAAGSDEHLTQRYLEQPAAAIHVDRCARDEGL